MAFGLPLGTLTVCHILGGKSNGGFVRTHLLHLTNHLLLC